MYYYYYYLLLRPRRRRGDRAARNNNNCSRRGTVFLPLAAAAVKMISKTTLAGETKNVFAVRAFSRRLNLFDDNVLWVQRKYYCPTKRNLDI